MTVERSPYGLASSWEALRVEWGWLLALGILWIVLGLAAFLLPFVATLATEILLGILFIIGGIAQLVQAFRSRGWRGWAWHGLGGGLALIAGALLLLFPIRGLLTVTLLLSVFFVVGGIMRIVLAFEQRALASWGWMLLSGILSIAVGVLIFMGWPSTSAWALGILVAIELIFAGWWMVALALELRRPAEAGRNA